MTELREWLEANFGQPESVWLVTHKKHVPEKYVSRSDVLDELLCFGWIDGRLLRLDDDRVMQLISPRRAHHWARSYKDRAERLELEERMREPGKAAIRLSKSLGLWDAVADVDALVIPADFHQALHGQNLLRLFEDLPPSYRRNLLRWVKMAKTTPTREKRISTILDSVVKGERIPQM